MAHMIQLWYLIYFTATKSQPPKKILIILDTHSMDINIMTWIDTVGSQTLNVMSLNWVRHNDMLYNLIHINTFWKCFRITMYTLHWKKVTFNPSLKKYAFTIWSPLSMPANKLQKWSPLISMKKIFLKLEFSKLGCKAFSGYVHRQATAFYL